MKRLFSCWLFSVVLALGFSAPAFADGKGHGHGHHHGGGGGSTSDMPIPLGDVFLPGDDESIFEKFSFAVGSQSSFSATIKSQGIDDFVGTLIGRKGNNFAQKFSFHDGMQTFSTLIGPGKYWFVLLGTWAEDSAFYAGRLSVAPVPEPAEWMMIIAGVAMMGFVVSRRRNIG